MEPGFVRELEQECEEVLNQVVEQHFDGLSPRIMHLMAKAAVTVLEAALESEDVEDEFVDEIDEELDEENIDGLEDIDFDEE